MVSSERISSRVSFNVDGNTFSSPPGFAHKDLSALIYFFNDPEGEFRERGESKYFKVYSLKLPFYIIA